MTLTPQQKSWGIGILIGVLVTAFGLFFLAGAGKELAPPSCWKDATPSAVAIGLLCDGGRGGCANAFGAEAANRFGSAVPLRTCVAFALFMQEINPLWYIIAGVGIGAWAGVKDWEGRSKQGEALAT